MKKILIFVSCMLLLSCTNQYYTFDKQAPANCVATSSDVVLVNGVPALEFECTTETDK